MTSLLSLAGRTERPAAVPVPVRTGGFGGADGLASFLRDHCIELVVDATHPFAARISAHAVAACAAAGVPRVVFSRPAWMAGPADRWTAVPDIPAAVGALGAARRRVLVTTGRLGLAAYHAAPQHHYLVRTIDPPDPADLPPDARLILARPPFTSADEAELMRREGVEVLVSKNSGGATAKLEAARVLGLPVVMVQRPPPPPGPLLINLDAVLALIATHARRP